MKIQKLVLILLALCILFCGCGVSDKTVSVDKLSVTLPGNYADYSNESFASYYTFTYGYQDVAVMGLKEEFSMFREYGLDPTLGEYLDLVISANGITQPATEDNGLHTFSFSSEVDGVMYTYLAAVYEGSDAFWLVQAGCQSQNYEKNQALFRQILHSVTVS